MGRLQADLSSTIALIVKKQIKSRLQCARRMQGIFWPSGRRHRLTGIKVADGSIITCPSMIQKELADHWGPIYQKKPIDLNAAKTLLGLYSRKHGELINGFRFCILPNSKVSCNIIKRVKDSAPGPDGIPYSAFAACIETSIVILANTSDYFSSSANVPDLERFNKQYCWFPPKGELEGDSVALIPTAGIVRIIFGSNSDSKLIASGVADAITNPTLAITPANQRGFCRGRQLSLNVVDVDSYMRPTIRSLASNLILLAPVLLRLLLLLHHLRTRRGPLLYP